MKTPQVPALPGMTPLGFKPAARRWLSTTEARYWEMLEVLPPAVMTGYGFMVGEPFDHTREGYPRYSAFVEYPKGTFFEAAEPMTVKEFKAVNPKEVR